MIEQAAIVVLANLLFYFKTLSYKYCSDDIPSYGRGKSRAKLKHWLYVLEGREKTTPHIDHFITMMIHTLVCLFIYLGFGANDISFLAALLFSFNPANNQGSVWISGRTYALPTLGLTMLMAFPKMAIILLAGICYFNSGFTAPLIFAGSPHPWILWFLPLAWFMNVGRFRKNVMGKVKMEMFDEDRKIHPKKLILFTKTFGWYLWHSLFPTKNTFYHAFLQSLAGCMSDKGYTLCRWFWFGLISGISAITYMIIHPWDLTNFAVLWFCFTIAPFCNLMRIHQEIAERYMYLPLVGAMYFLANFLVGYPVISAMFLTMYATRMWFYMDAYQDDYYLVENSALASPNSWFALHVKAMKRWDAGSHQEALIYWNMARGISPKEFKVNFNLGTAMMTFGQVERAEEFYKVAMENIPKGQEKQSKELYKTIKEEKKAAMLL